MSERDWIETFGRAPSAAAEKSGMADGPALVDLRAQGEHRDALLAIVQALLNMHGFDASHPIDLDSHSLEIVLPPGWRSLPIVQMMLPGLAVSVADFLKGERSLRDLAGSAA
jgi:hypothetical protein